MQEGHLGFLSRFPPTIETFDHIFRSHDFRADTISTWKDCRKAMSMQYTCPAVVTALNKGICVWIETLDAPFQQQHTPLTQRTNSWLLDGPSRGRSAEIGWGQAIRGHISQLWSGANKRY